MGSKPTNSPFIQVKRSRIHGTGVFAKTDIPEGTRIIEYIGEKITKKESGRRSVALIEKNSGSKTDGAVYIFELNKRHDIDGNVPENTARFINHSCGSNCEPQIIRGHIWIVATRDIKKKEELGYNYGFDFENYEEHPCRCGSGNCIGYIVADEHWPRVKRVLARNGKKINPKKG